MGIRRDPHRLLTIGDYLRQRGLTPSAVRRTVPDFGDLVKRRYVKQTGRKPCTGTRYANGHLVQVCLYRESDRHLFDSTWADMWAGLRITLRQN